MRLLGEAGSYACFCPTTERDLGDGIGPSRALHDAGATLTLGSDSHAVIDLFEEMRAVELDERLATQRRGHWSSGELFDAATADGHASLGFSDAGSIAVGQRADLVTVATDTPRTAGTGRGLETVVYAATGADVRHVVVGGRSCTRPTTSPGSAPSWTPRSSPRPVNTTCQVLTGRAVVRGRMADDITPGHRHRRADHLPHRARMTSVDTRPDAAFVVERGRVAWVGPSGEAPAADQAHDVGGRAVVPGFVDSHSHLVFAGDRGQEFAARMAGERYAAGGIRTTVAATRAATDEQLTAGVARHVTEMRRQGTTSVEIKSGYGLTVLDEARGLAVARQFTEDTTFLGAHVVPPEYADDPAGYVALVTGPMLDAAAPHARWIDVFCETGAFDADQARAILLAGRERDLRRAAARQPARPRSGGPAGLRARSGGGRPLHLPRGRRRLRAPRLGHHRDPAARRRVLDPLAVPRRPCAGRLGREGGAGQRLQSGLLLHQLDAVVRGARGARDADDAGRGAVVGDRRRRPRARPRRRRAARRGVARGLRGAGRAVVPPPRLPARCPAGGGGLRRDRLRCLRPPGQR